MSKYLVVVLFALNIVLAGCAPIEEAVFYAGVYDGCTDALVDISGEIYRNEAEDYCADLSTQSVTAGWELDIPEDIGTYAGGHISGCIAAFALNSSALDFNLNESKIHVFCLENASAFFSIFNEPAELDFDSL